MAARALVERSHEITSLRSALARAETDGEVVVLEGPAGIGKTRLLDVLRREANAFEVLVARSGALERDIAFGVVRQLFERRLTKATPAESETLLSGAAGPASEVLGIAGETAGSEPSELSRSLHGLFWLVANLAELRPLLLAVDDVHWADGASVEFLAYLARRLEGLPVLVVVAARDGEAWSHDGARADLLALSTVVRPPPLSPAGIGELIRVAFGAPGPAELVEACATATGGNPFYLGELLDAVAANGGDPADVPIDAVRATVPSTVSRSVLLRLGRLGDAATRFAMASALLGDGAALRHAGALAGLSVSAGEEAADQLVAASILRSAAPLRFSHPIIEGAIAGESPAGRRGGDHRRAALILDSDGAPIEAVVPHLLRASPAGDPWVVETLRHAAAVARSRGVPELAVRCLRRALEEPPTSDLDVLLGELSLAELASGAYPEGASTATRAIEAATGDPAARARIRLHQALALLFVEGAPAALRCLEQGITDANGPDPDLALRLEAELAIMAWFADRPHTVLDRANRHRNLPGETTAQRCMLGVLSLEALRRHEGADVARSLAVRALANGGLSAHTLSYHAAVLALIAAEAHEDARRAVADGAAECESQRSVFGYAGVSWVRGLLALAEGDLVAAEAAERDCVEHAAPTMVAVGGASLALVLLEQGDVAGAAAELARNGLLNDNRPLYFWGPYVRGRVRLAQGRPSEAFDDLAEVGRHITDAGGYSAGLPWQAYCAIALGAMGDTSAAHGAAEAELDRARRHGGARTLGIALWAYGLVSVGEARLARLADAVEVLERTPPRLDLAHAGVDLGISLLRAGQRREGREILQRAYESARSCGARGLARTAHDELVIAGARPRGMTAGGVESLTASERRVAAMAAEGQSNRDIAQALFVTPKTVENQLGRVYVKLGVTSRRDLGQALSD